jgi:circadian clock protein KaiB
MKSAKSKPARRAAPARKKSPARPPVDKHVLRLFVAGATARSRQAILRVRELCADELKNLCDLEVIDIYQQPALARKNQIVATPTLIIEFPPPLRRFIGNLANISGLFVELDLIKRVKITA